MLMYAPFETLSSGVFKLPNFFSEPLRLTYEE
ncbi:hypothetical protein MY3296_009286 [Beauveria thailandica]